MKCNEINDLLSLYIDHMLEKDQEVEVEAHLSSCEACRIEYNAMKEIVDLLGQTEMLPVPDAFSFRLKQALKEEKQTMIATGIIPKPLKKKTQWRMITSVAAVFAVGVITLGLYQDILNIVPDQINGGGQTEIAQPEEEYSADDSKAGVLNGEADDSNISSDGSVMMKEGNDEVRSMLSTESPVSNDQAVSGTEEDTYGAVSDSAPEIASESTEMENTEEFADIEAATGFRDDALKFKSMSPVDCSRSLTTSGVERNAAAVQFYDNLIEEKLEGFDYQILESSYSNDGVWHFRIFIFRGKDGNTYNEEIMICGKEGEIKVLDSNEFMGL